MRAPLPSGTRWLAAVFVLTLPLVTPSIRGADEIEYFSHLRSLVFDHDLEFGDEYAYFYAQDPEGLAGFRATFLDKREPRTGRHINFGPIGSAVLWSPFYLAAHAAVLGARAAGADVAADGYSRPYVAAVCFASAVYGFLGLLLIHDLLRREAGTGEPAATATVLALWLGTPVLYYMTLAPAFSHACSLFAVSLLLWLWRRARRRDDRLGDWALVGLCGGVAALVREQDVFFLLLPCLDLAWRTLVARRTPPAASAVRLAAIGVCAALAFSPQLLAYHAINGSYGPSRMVAQKMTWSSPHFFQVLLDPGHGLFAWSPLLLAAVAGLLLGALRRRDGTTVLLALAFLLQVWINGCVESWTQAGAFGSRRFVATTPVFAWGLAALLQPAWGWSRRAVVAMLLLVVWWNLSLMVQFGLKLMNRQRLEWPRVAVNQLTQVPPRLGRAAWLFFADREALVRETR